MDFANTWTLIQKQLKGTVGLSRALPIVGNIEFLPCISDNVFKRWVDNGLIVLGHLFYGQTLKSFSQLQEEFALPPGDLYRYLQIRNYLTKHGEWDIVKKEPTDIEIYFVNLFENRGSTKKLISVMYRKLLSCVR